MSQEMPFGSAGSQEKPQGISSQAAESSRVDLQRRLEYLGLTEADADRLRTMLPDFDASGDAFVEAFYEHLFAFNETKQFLNDSEMVARLRTLQRAHFKSLLEAEWSEEYVEERTSVGRAHAHVGLSPQWFLGAHSLYVQHCLRGLMGNADGKADENAEKGLTLMKVIFLDIGLTLDAYFDQSTEELRQALDLYWRANDELRRFAQLASHDLKTPIATVANLCDETLDEFGDEMPEGARELIRSARDRVFKTSTMIDELLESTLRAHEEESFGVVDLGEVFSDILDRLKKKMAEKDVEVSLPNTFPKVRGDRARFREAIYNLLANAVKFMDKSPGQIDVTAEIEEGGTQCVVSITDNGPGIPESELQRIFVPFHRLNEHRDTPGSGLGLYFTMYLLEREGGRIWAESKLGQGSCFRMQLNCSSK